MQAYRLRVNGSDVVDYLATSDNHAIVRAMATLGKLTRIYNTATIWKGNNPHPMTQISLSNVMGGVLRIDGQVYDKQTWRNSFPLDCIGEG